MKYLHLAVTCLLAATVLPSFADEGPQGGTFTKAGTVSDPKLLRPTSPEWEKAYQQRVDAMINAKTWPLGGLGDPDSGKRAWPAILAELYKVRNNPAAMDAIIAKDGKSAMLSDTAGSWNKPFSCPGFALYYFKMKDRLPADQKAHVVKMINSVGWSQVTRADQHMDPIYKQTEFNSENFNWMSHLCGFLFARELKNAQQTAFFDNYVNNWVRALYNAGRVEWDSTVYWGHTFYPILVMYECAPDAESKLKAQAALDWMVITIALHYQDGSLAGPDARAKSHPYEAFYGSAWDYGYLYFGDKGFPSYAPADAVKHATQHVAFAAWSSYRPPQVAIDIAQRKFAKPVEMHNAKAFYHVDFDSYADWKGNTPRSRRFEFETMFYDDNFSLGSLAAGRPDGKIGTFSEENVWRLAVTSSSGGAKQVFGNSGEFKDAGGRCPYEEIGQYRSAVMRLIQGADNMWVALPKECQAEWEGDRVFVDLGNDVYAAIQPFKATGHSDADIEAKTGPTHHRYTWAYAPTDLGGLVIEVGTKKAHGSYAEFKKSVNAKTAFTSAAADIVEYTATTGGKLKMQFMPLQPYKMSDGSGMVVEKGGVTPKVWNDGQYLDYQTWQVYHAVSGEPICEIPRGSGSLTSTIGGKGLQIVVDPQTAKVEYRKIPQ